MLMLDLVSYSCYMAQFFNSEHQCWRILPAKKKRILPVTVEESCQWLLNNRASDCWTIMPVTVDQSSQWLLNDHASYCWTKVPATVERSFQLLLKNYTSHCWRTVPVTVQELCQWLLNNCASDSETPFGQLIVFTEMNLWTDYVVRSEMPFGRDLCLTETGQLICNVNELTGFYIAQDFTERYFWIDIVVFSWILLVERTPIIRKPANWFAIQIVWVFAEKDLCTHYDWRHHLIWILFQ